MAVDKVVKYQSQQLRRKVLWFATITRAFVLVLQAVAHYLIPDHKAQDVFISPSGSNKTHIGDNIVDVAIGGLKRWDAQHFMHIAEYGYTYEFLLAFCPSFPWLTRFFANGLHSLTSGVLICRSAFLITAVLINSISYVLAALTLYDLSRHVLRNERLAYTAALMFCITPANIFFTAPYSESLFFLTTLYGLLLCENGHLLVSSAVFGITGILRSNGCLNVGFVLYKQLQRAAEDLHFLTVRKNCKNIIYIVFRELVMALTNIILSWVLFFGFQYYSYKLFCIDVSPKGLPNHIINYASENSQPISSNMEIPSWCNNTVPLSYSSVQKHYWNVGFLSYYQFKKIPNFLLATPVLCIILSQSVQFIKENWNYCASLGLTTMAQEKSRKYQLAPLTQEVFVYVIHGIVMAFCCLTFIHIEVSTRMLASASPLLYWFASVTLNKAKINKTVETLENLNSKWKIQLFTSKYTGYKSRLILWYFIVYTIIGTILFANFYPWT